MWDSKKGGFTLIEILIAITLLAFISLGIVSITSNSQNTKDRTIEKDKDNLQIETAMSRFEWDVSQIYSPLYFSLPPQTNYQNELNRGQVDTDTQLLYESLQRPYEGNQNFAFASNDGLPVPRYYAPEKSIFEFFTSSNRRKLENQKQSQFMWVRYSLAEADKDEDPYGDDEEKKGFVRTGKNFVRYVQADDPYSPERIDINKVKAQVLLENVESLEFQYWNVEGKRWETSLRSIKMGEHLIRGVQILISWYDSRGQKREAVRSFRPLFPEQTIENTKIPSGNTGTTGASGATTGTQTTGNNTANNGTTTDDGDGDND